MSRRTSAVIQASVAGIVLFGLAIAPTVGIFVAARSGSVGSLPAGTWFAVPASLFVMVLAVGAGVLVYRAAIHDPRRRAGTIWSSYVDGLAVVVLGCWLIPFVLLFTLVDSDHSLDQRGPAVVVAWLLAHGAVAVVALAVSRRLRA